MKGNLVVMKILFEVIVKKGMIIGVKKGWCRKEGIIKVFGKKKTGSILAAGNNNRLLKWPRAAGSSGGERGRVRKRDGKRKREWAGNVWAGVCSECSSAQSQWVLIHPRSK